MERSERLSTQVWDALGVGSTDSGLWRYIQRQFGYTHLVSVATLCALLAVRRGYDAEVCRAAGILHDLWLYINIPEIPTPENWRIPNGWFDHGRHGAVKAREFLHENGEYGEEEISQICQMIANHNDKEDKHDVLSELLKDADALAHLLSGTSYGKNYRDLGRLGDVVRELGIDSGD